MKDYYTVPQFAALAGLDQSYIRRLIKQKRIKARKHGGRWVIDKPQGKIWLENFKAGR